MAFMLTVETDKVDALKRALPATGCRMLRVRPRSGYSSDSKSVRNVEIELPRLWKGSMSDALYDLPGVLMVSGTVSFGKPSLPARFFHALGWYLMPSHT